MTSLKEELDLHQRAQAILFYHLQALIQSNVRKEVLGSLVMTMIRLDS